MTDVKELAKGPHDRLRRESCNRGTSLRRLYASAWQRGFGLQILVIPLLLVLGCLGCVSSRTLANRALHAPNRQIKLPKEFRQLDAALETNFPIQRIAVGPPSATLELMVLQPGNYGAKIKSAFALHHPWTYEPGRRCPLISRQHKPYYEFNASFRFSGFSPETNDVRGTIFLLPGYGLNKETMLPWGMVLAEAGYRTVLVDLRGHGRSTGDRIYFGGIERTDMVQCLDALMQRRVCEGPVGVLGISYGAVVALEWAAMDPRVQSVVAISPYPDPGTAVYRYLKTFAPNLTWRTDRKVASDVASRLAAEFPGLATITAVRRIQHPILFVRGEHDEVCARADLSHFQAAALPGSEVQEVPLADHLVVGMCLNQLRKPVTEWFDRHLTR